MRGGRFVVIVIAVAAIAVAAVVALTGGGGDDKGGGGGNGGEGTKPASDAVRVSFVYSPEKEALIAPLIRQFNGGHHESGAHPVFVDATIVDSGEAEAK